MEPRGRSSAKEKHGFAHAHRPGRTSRARWRIPRHGGDERKQLLHKQLLSRRRQKKKLLKKWLHDCDEDATHGKSAPVGACRRGQARAIVRKHADPGRRAT